MSLPIYLCQFLKGDHNDAQEITAFSTFPEKLCRITRLMHFGKGDNCQKSLLNWIVQLILNTNWAGTDQNKYILSK